MANSQGTRRINFLDFLLIVLIIATVSAAIVSVIRSNPNQISGGDTEIVYTIRCDMVDKSSAQNIKNGDSIYDNETNQLLGTVISVNITESIMALPNNSDNPDDIIDTGKVILEIGIRAKVWKNNDIYSIDKYRVAEGVEIAFHSTDFSYTGLCVLVTENGGGN